MSGPMRRYVLALQIGVSAGLVALWTCSRPDTPDCGGTDCAPPPIDGESPFVPVRPAPEGAGPPTTVAAPLTVEYGGCESIVTSDDDEIVCSYEPGVELRLWVVHPGVDRVEALLDGSPWTATRYDVVEEPGEGLRGLVLGEDARRLEVRAPDGQTWMLPLRARTRASKAERSLRERLQREGRDLEDRAHRGETETVAMARQLVEVSKENGLLSEGIDLALGVAYELAWYGGQPARAEALLEAVAPDARRYPEGNAALAIYLGHALDLQGRLVAAARAYRRGGRYSVRMDDGGLQLDALPIYAHTLADLGYFEAAIYWGDRSVERARAQGELEGMVKTMLMVATTNIELSRSGRTHEDPGPLLTQVIALSLDGGATRDLMEARLAQAELVLLRGDAASALRALDELDDENLATASLATRDRVRLQALLDGSSSERELRRAQAQLADAVERAGLPELHWMAEVHHGKVLERLEDLDGAREAYQRSEALLDELIPLSLLGGRGEVAPAQGRESTQRLVSLLLRQGDSEAALCTVRRARARVGQLARLFPRLHDGARDELRARITEYLEAKAEHEALLQGARSLPGADRERALREAARRKAELDRSAMEILGTQAGYRGLPQCDELGARIPGELFLGLYPRGDDLIVFVQDDQGTSHRVLSDHHALTGPEDLEWLSRVLLEPLDDRLDAASRVRVLASGEAATIDVHALTWRDEPLVAQVPVVYGLDLPLRPSPAESGAAGRPRALVISDAGARGASEEAKAIDGLLATAGWDVERSTSAHHGAGRLREDLAEVDLLHYAGHAYYDVGGSIRRAGDASGGSLEPVLHLWPPYPGGAAAEPSYIPLGPTDRLDVQDVLMMEQVPRSVVLMGCATGVHDERMAYGGLSMAAAFVAAGSEMVVASTREVDGKEASLVGRGLHAATDGRAAVEPGTWLKQALSWARARGLPSRALRDYRVYVP